MTQQTKTYVLGVLAVVLIVGLVWWGANRDQAASTTGESIEIGAIFMLSGLGSNWGENSRQGTELAAQEINERGGINGRPLEIIYEDNQGDNPKQAVSALQSLIRRNVNIVLGPNWSPSGIAVAPIACEQSVLMISPSLGVADFNESCDYTFNLWPHDELLSKLIGEYLYEEQGIRNVAILGTQQEWDATQAEAVRAGFERSGGTVVSFQLAQVNQSDFRTEAAKIKNSNAEAVVFTNYAFQHVSAKQLKEIGVELPLFSVLIDGERIKGAEGALEGATVGTYFTPSEEFTKRFKEMYATEPDIGSDTSYDAVMLLAQAMKETGSTDANVLKDYLNSLQTYDGMSGDMTFDGKGGVTKETRFMVVKNDELVPYEPAN